MHPVVRIAALILLSLALTAAVPLLGDLRPADDADRSTWRSELQLLEQHLSVAYANFEWTVAARQLDLPALHREADSAIAVADNRHGARAAVRKLVSAFDDGHLRVSPPDHPFARIAERSWRGGRGPIDRATPAARACRRLGFDNRSNRFETPFDRLPNYREIAAEPFRAGLIEGNGRRVGVIRVSHFGEDGYAGTCEDAWSQTPGLPHQCDDACREAIYAETGNLLLAGFAEALEALARAGAEALVVDVTGNGGGTDLADAMARQLTAVPLRGLPTGGIRHPHSAGALRSTDSLLAMDAADPRLPEERRALAASMRTRVARLLADVETPCDLTPLWRGSSAACPQLVRDSTWATGLLDYAAPGSLAGMAAADRLFGPSAYRYREGAWQRPVVVLMDRGSASATELFAALLRDNGAAIAVGERSYGAGCGYTRGGVTLELPALALTLRAPDCARFRASGENERAGITPDIALDPGDAAAVLAAVSSPVSPPSPPTRPGP